jgi:hypothetical protein
MKRASHASTSAPRRRSGLLLILGLALLSSPAHAAPPPPTGNIASRVVSSTVDILLLRPMAVAATAVGAVTYAVVLPLTWPLGGEEQAREDLVLTPFGEAFQRPLGEW